MTLRDKAQARGLDTDRAERRNGASHAIYGPAVVYDAALPKATPAERVTVVSPLEQPRIEARAKYKLDDLVRRGAIADVRPTATADFTNGGYDLTIDYRDLLAGRPGRVNIFVPAI
jgi:hypothetical protein